MDEQLMTEAVRKILRVSAPTVRRYADLGLLPCSKTPDGRRLFQLKDVLLFLKKRRGARK